jgi:uncharacterized membrane protein
MLQWHITYYVLLKGWVQIFGESELAVRSLSLLFFGLNVLAVGLIVQRITDWKGGLIAALLLSTSWLGLEHAANARQYALLSLLTAVSALVYLYVMRVIRSSSEGSNPRSPVKDARAYLLLIAVNVLGLLTHPIYGFVIFAFLFAAIFISRRTVLLLGACAAVSLGIYLGLWGPILYATLGLPGTWYEVPSLTELRDAFVRLWGFGPLGIRDTYLLAIYSLAITGVHFNNGTRVLTSKPFLVSFAVLVVASLAPFMVSQYRPIFLAERTPVIFLPIACLVMAILIRQLGLRPLTGLVLALLVFTSGRWAVQTSAAPDPYPARASIQYVAGQVACGDVLILGSLSVNEVEYYFRQFAVPECVRRETFPLDTQDHPGWVDIPGLLRQRETLTQEAAATVARHGLEAGKSVWLFEGPYGREVTQIIKAQLDQSLASVKTLHISGSFFDTVVIYSTRS